MSNKDASHCLYTAKIKKLALANANHKAFKNLNNWLEEYVVEMTKHFELSELDSSST